LSGLFQQEPRSLSGEHQPDENAKKSNKDEALNGEVDYHLF